MTRINIGGKIGKFFNHLGEEIVDVAQIIEKSVLDVLDQAGGYVTQLINKGDQIVHMTDDFMNKNLINEMKNFPFYS